MKERTEEISIPFILLDVSLDELNNKTGSSNQYGITSKIVRIGYLLQNFKKPIVQHRGGESKKSSKGLCSRAEVRWYGGKHDSLVNLRVDVRLWGMQCEIDHHSDLSTAHLGQSALQISEMVLAERCKRSCMNSKEKNMTGCIK